MVLAGLEFGYMATMKANKLQRHLLNTSTAMSDGQARGVVLNYGILTIVIIHITTLRCTYVYVGFADVPGTHLSAQDYDIERSRYILKIIGGLSTHHPSLSFQWIHPLVSGSHQEGFRLSRPP